MSTRQVNHTYGTFSLMRLLITPALIILLVSPLYPQGKITPPPDSDRKFVVKEGPDLDTGCVFRSRGPLRIEIPIDRFVGPVDSEGKLKDLDVLVTNQIISENAILDLPVFDVDLNPPDNLIKDGLKPERDLITFNGERIFPVGGIDNRLTGANEEWKPNQFIVPISMVKFPGMGSPGNKPDPAINTVEIRIDEDNIGNFIEEGPVTGNQYNTDEFWCTEVDWVALSFKAQSPVILVHGNNSDGGFWVRHGFKAELNSRKIPNDNSISLVTSRRYINAIELSVRIPDIVKQFGVDGIHIIAHSKGGLDTREFIARYLPVFKEDFEVLSLTTLSTPHNGSVGADFLVVQQQAPFILGAGIKGDILSRLTDLDLGTLDLTTQAAIEFNNTNLPNLPESITYQAVAADADQNGNGRIDLEPFEFLELLLDGAELNDKFMIPIVGPFLATFIVNEIYQVMRNFTSVELIVIEIFGKTIFEFGLAVPAVAQLNDVLVAINSANDSEKFKNIATLILNEGRNHSSVSNTGVAVIVIPTIQEIERTKGDFQ